MKNKLLLSIFSLLILASCSTQKQATKSSRTPHADPAVAFVEDVIDNDVDVQNIVGNASIRVTMDSQTMKLSGALRMRRGEVVRLQLMLPIIGTEVARIEFTPTYVLIIDRMNKQYLKADYSQVDFLSKNNITFRSLEALFWNELISSRHCRATFSEAEEFTANLSATGSYVPITRQEGDTKMQWNASRTDHTLTSAVLSYGTSMLTWLYSNFTPLADKKFPRTQEFSFSTSIHSQSVKATFTIDMSDIKTPSDWEAHTEVSSKYKEVSAESVLSRLMNMLL